MSLVTPPVNVGKHQFTLFKVIRLRDFVIHTLQVSVSVFFKFLSISRAFSSVIILAMKNVYLGDFLM